MADSVMKQGLEQTAVAKAKPTNVVYYAPNVSEEKHKDNAPPGSFNVESKFSHGDGVVVQNVQGRAITGTVRWTGSFTTAGKVVVPVVIGIETVSVL